MSLLKIAMISVPCWFAVMDERGEGVFPRAPLLPPDGCAAPRSAVAGVIRKDPVQIRVAIPAADPPDNVFTASTTPARWPRAGRVPARDATTADDRS
jgi:hypothetical protein